MGGGWVQEAGGRQQKGPPRLPLRFVPNEPAVALETLFSCANRFLQLPPPHPLLPLFPLFFTSRREDKKKPQKRRSLFAFILLLFFPLLLLRAGAAAAFVYE